MVHSVTHSGLMHRVRVTCASGWCVRRIQECTCEIYVYVHVILLSVVDPSRCIVTFWAKEEGNCAVRAG